MKYLVLLISLLISLTSWGTNRAVIIGIGNYPDNSGWSQISSENDIRILDSTFRKYFKEVEILKDKDATYNGIIHKLKTFKCEKGDTVWCHFSCHGQQYYSKAEKDWLEECLIPYDACIKYSTAYHGQHHLKDDTLSSLINDIRDKIGGDGLVIVTLDACHSGESNKGGKAEEKQRGTYDVFSEIQLGEQILDSIYEKRQFKDTTSFFPRKEGTAHVCYISACQSDELNREYKGYGSLSYAIYMALSKSKNFNLDSLIVDIKNGVEKEVAQKIDIKSTMSLPAELYSNQPVDIIADSEENEQSHKWLLLLLIPIIGIIVILLKRNGRK